MTEIPSKYDSAKAEDKWYAWWLENKFFHSVPDNREPFTIVIPPPNVTGVLHMGHMLNNTLQDVLIRRAKMSGKNTCWVPGTDHASIATEAKVVAMLKSKGIEKNSLSREEFLKYAWEWREKHGGIILEQLKKLGASCDWERTCFTMDKSLSESVIKVFVELYNKGYIYRGVRMVNWDPQAKTAVSDEEVIYKEEQSLLYYVKYKITDSDEFITIATTRPETILGDTAVCVNPKDERYSHLRDKKVVIPLVNRVVPVIFDEYADTEFGTGALKVTPAHDINDYELGIKYNLESIDIFNDDGTLNNKAELFIGTDRFKARTLVAGELQKQGLLGKTENYTNKIGYSERTNEVIEPRLSIQWFLKMKELSIPALENVINDNIMLIPAKFKNTYRHWMENVHDWCISRQLWWGHRIPAWYINDTGQFVVAENAEQAIELARKKFPGLEPSGLKQDEDVLDTWFSSWLWPISVFDGIRNPANPDFKYYYPTNELVTAPEILFFWVARMIIAGYEFAGEKPFRNVYLTGIVRDKQGRKMSKQLGNSPEPLDLIKEYGADGVRAGMLFCSPAGNDLLFDNSLPEQGRNFGNKIWNAFRLVKMWQVDDKLPQPEHSKIAATWFGSVLNKTVAVINGNFEKYRISEALMEVYRLFRDEFSSWYLEIIKPQNTQAVDKKTYNEAIGFFDTLLKLLHPFMPFITEEIWHYLAGRGPKESIMNTMFPENKEYDTDLIEAFEQVKSIASNIRAIKTAENIPFKEQLECKILSANGGPVSGLLSVVTKLCNISNIGFISSKPANSASFMVKTTEYFIPLGARLNTGAEITKLNSELSYFKGFLASVEKKLSNPAFTGNAPEQVVNNELAKKSDALTKISAIERQLKLLEEKTGN